MVCGKVALSSGGYTLHMQHCGSLKLQHAELELQTSGFNALHKQGGAHQETAPLIQLLIPQCASPKTARAHMCGVRCAVRSARVHVCACVNVCVCVSRVARVRARVRAHECTFTLTCAQVCKHIIVCTTHMYKDIL